MGFNLNGVIEMIDFPTDEEIKADIENILKDNPEIPRQPFVDMMIKTRDDLIERARWIDKILLNQPTPEQIEELREFTRKEL